MVDLLILAPKRFVLVRIAKRILPDSVRQLPNAQLDPGDPLYTDTALACPQNRVQLCRMGRSNLPVRWGASHQER